jgi:hypothetical protein
MCLDREIDFQIDFTDVFKVSELVWDAVSAPDDRDRRRELTYTARTEDIQPRDSTDQSHDLDSPDFEPHKFRSGVTSDTIFVWPYRFEAVRRMLEERHHMRSIPIVFPGMAGHPYVRRPFPSKDDRQI